MTRYPGKSVEFLRTLGRHEATKSLIPVSLVVAFGVVWTRFQPEFFWQDDFQTQYLPASREIARALSAGELPILTDRAWFGAALAGEYQHGALSVSSLVLNWLAWKLGLSLPGTASALVLAHLSLVSAGTFRLARARGLDAPEATLAALVAALNGWLIGWGKSWYPAIVSFTWVPWAWWALERALSLSRRPLDVVLAGTFIYLVLAAGWPFTVLMIALLTVCLAVQAWLHTRAPLAIWPAAVAWVIGLGFSAPALMIFLEYGGATNRGAEGLALDRQWLVPLAGLSGLILPAANAFWRGYQTYWVTRPSVELAGGLVPLCAVLWALWRHGRSALRGSAFAGVVAFLALLAAVLPCVRPTQTSFRWLPLFHLAFGLVGAACVHHLRKGVSPATPAATAGFWARRPLLPLAILTAVLIALATLISLGEGLDPYRATWALGSTLFCLALGWSLIELLAVRRLDGWPTVLFGLAALAATYRDVPPLADTPRWRMPESVRDNAPYRTDIRYLAMYDIAALLGTVQPPDARAYGVGKLAELRPGYVALYSDLQFVNGYSPMLPFGPATVLMLGLHGETNLPQCIHLLRDESRDGGLLDLMATDGVVVMEALQGELEPLKQAGWHEVGRVPEGIVLERQRRPSSRVRALPRAETVPDKDDMIARIRQHTTGPVPLLLTGSQPKSESFANAALQNLRESRRQSQIHVSVPTGERPALVAFSRPWLPGWRASLNGRPLQVEQLDLLLPAVRLPPGASGELTLDYRPDSLVRGLWVAFATLMASLAWLASPGALRALRGNRRATAP